MSGNRHWEQDKESTLYVGNLDERCTDSLVWELMLQAGPVVNVHLPKDRVTQNHQGYGFVEFGSEADADYAAKIMNQIRVWGKPIRVNKASADKRGAEGGTGASQSVGAELFVGNLDNFADEKVLYETFSRFGPLVQAPKIARDESNMSKGYGFISYASFEASDDAIANMHGQYLSSKEITVQYAYKKDGKGERHGDPAERALAAQAKLHGVEVSIPAMPASLITPYGTPSGPASMQPGFAPPAPAHSPSPWNPGSYGQNATTPYGNYNAYPPPASMGGFPPSGYPPQRASPWAPAPPSGSMGYPPQQAAPMGYPPPSAPPTGFPPSGPPSGFPPSAPPTGFPQPGSRPPPGLRTFNQSPLPAPPAGLPQKPPSAAPGHGPPPGPPPGFPAPPNGFPPTGGQK